jgi:hypothetical protein
VVLPRGIDEMSTTAAKERLATAASWVKVKEYFMADESLLYYARGTQILECSRMEGQIV